MPDSKARENAARVRGQTKRQRKPKQKGDADHSVSQQGVGKVADVILGRDYGQATFERHAALLGDPHLTGPRYANQRADIAKQLQKDYGNRYVQRVISRISERRTEADQTDSSVGSLRGMTDVVQRTPIDSLIQRETHGVGDTTYLVLDTVPGTRFEVVRTNWHPWSERKIYDTASGTVLAMSLTSDEGTNIRAAFQGLIAQGGHDLNGLMEDIDKAAGNGVPVNVSIGRLGSITQYIRDVVLARLAADRADLKARGLLSATVPAAFDEAFQSIEIPGSDPHKGGQVVIFVNYNAGGDTSERIVYEPGDLRVDQFLSGSDPASIASRIGGGMASYQILTKEVAGHGVDERLKHYGYMQFVESGQPQSTDDVLGIYKGLGKGLAVGYVFGLRDLHYENYILLQNDVLFLDLEAATGTFTGFGSMEFHQVPTKLAERIGIGMGDKTVAEAEAMIPADAALIAQVLAGATETLNTMGGIGEMGGDDGLGETLQPKAPGLCR